MQNNYHIWNRKQAKTSKQCTGTEDRLSNIQQYLNDVHVALISVIAAFLFSSHHGSIFCCFVDSLYSWRFTENNHLMITSATKHRKVKGFMRGKKYMKIKTIYFTTLSSTYIICKCIPISLKVLFRHDLSCTKNLKSDVNC